MEDEDEDNIYAPAESTEPDQSVHVVNGTGKPSVSREGRNDEEDGEEEGEELEEDESDSDIDIITERKGSEAKPEPAQPRRVVSIKEPQLGTPSAESVPAAQRSPTVKTETSGKETPTRLGSSYPAVKTSNIDVDAKPIYEPNGKPITDIDMDTDFPEDDKPWRRPGTDMTDYFNYGFDEFTWASYCLKQGALRKEVTDSKKQMEDMQSFLSMPSAMPGISGAPGGAPPGMPPMGGPADMPPEMQQMMAQMMAQGMDPTQMDPATFMTMMQGAQGGGGGDSNQNFGGQGFGQQGQNQQMGYGYGGGGGGRNQGGRGNRRW